MSRIYSQEPHEVWRFSGSLAAGASMSSGSFVAKGHARLVGGIISNASAAAASGVRVYQSIDNGLNWDFYTDTTLSACSGSAYSYEIIGDLIKINFYNGADSASYLRTMWWMRAV
jgi:hypothetical protein